MTEKSGNAGIPFRWVQMTFIFLIIVLVTGVVLFVNYSDSREVYEQHIDTLSRNTEYTLIQSLKFVDRGLYFLDYSLDFRLRPPMERFLAAYEESGADPAGIDLEALQAELGPGYDLYIINEAGIVEYTTYLPDHGLDFSRYPIFFERLTGIREGDSFASDRISYGFTGTMARKFVYHPTPDNRYILELSYYDDEIRLLRQDLRYTEAADAILEQNPYLESVRIFNSLGHQVSNASYVPGDEEREIILDVHRTGEIYEIEDPESGTLTRYLLVPLANDHTPREMDLVASLTYSTAPVEAMLDRIFHSHLIIGVVALIIGGGLAFSTTVYFTRPIEDLMADTEEIRKGDLNHPIRASTLPELRSFSLSLREMVEKLKQTMTSLQESEERYRFITENTADIIWILDMQFNFQYISPSVQKMRGFTVEEAMGQNLEDAITPESKDHVIALFEREMAEITDLNGDPNRTVTFVTEEYRKDGTIIILENTATMLWGDDGRPIGMIGTSRDVTEKKQAEEEREAAFHLIDENIYHLSILNDQIRNPLSVIMGLASLEGGEKMERIIGEVKKIDTIIDQLDKGLLESELVRQFLRKHYEKSEDE